MIADDKTGLITAERICEDLGKLGVEPGDKLLVTSSLKAIGRLERGPETLFDGLMAVVGPAGAIFGLSFTRSFPIPLSAEAQKHVFTRETPPLTGAFNAYLVARPDSYRSSHPTSSFIGFGAGVREILQDHVPGVMGYDPVARLARQPRSFMLALGTLELGVTTVHVTQNLLGLKTRYGGKYGVHYLAPHGEIKFYVRDYVGGCSLGFPNLYPYYRKAGAMREGNVGNALSGLTNLQQSLKIDMELLRADPTIFFCDSPDCFQCRAGWEHSQTSYLRFQLQKIRRRFLGR